jgi:hypothetical protein
LLNHFLSNFKLFYLNEKQFFRGAPAQKIPLAQNPRGEDRDPSRQTMIINFT